MLKSSAQAKFPGSGISELAALRAWICEGGGRVFG